MGLLIFDSDWDASDYCHFHPHEIVYSTETNRFYYCILEGNEIYESYFVPFSDYGSEEFYVELEFVRDSLISYLEVSDNA